MIRRRAGHREHLAIMEFALLKRLTLNRQVLLLGELCRGKTSHTVIISRTNGTEHFQQAPDRRVRMESNALPLPSRPRNRENHSAQRRTRHYGADAPCP